MAKVPDDVTEPAVSKVRARSRKRLAVHRTHAEQRVRLGVLNVVRDFKLQSQI
tara:strand:- start:318 stop:476 length:159 start_codon:yes stop_codon:yes gene_type:complete